jgi:hypothetical protein
MSCSDRLGAGETLNVLRVEVYTPACQSFLSWLCLLFHLVFVLYPGGTTTHNSPKGSVVVLPRILTLNMIYERIF